MSKIHKSQSNPSLNHCLLILSILIFANTLFSTWNFAVKYSTIDFYTWWVVPHTLSKHNIQNIYSEEGRKELADIAVEESKAEKISPAQRNALKDILVIYEGKIITTATPFFYSAFNRLVSHSYFKDRLNFITLSMVCAAASYFILGRLLGYSWTVIFLLSSYLFAFYSPCQSDVKVGNCNQFQLLLLSLFIWFFSQEKKLYFVIAAGFILGLAIMLKPNMVFIALFSFLLFLLKRDFNKLPAFSLGMLISFIMALWEGITYFQNTHIWKDWLATLSATISYAFTQELGNYSLTKMIYDASHFKISEILYLIMLVIFILLIIYRYKISYVPSKLTRLPKENDTLTDTFIITGFGSISLLLASGLVWAHYYILTIPIIFYLLQPNPDSILSDKDIQIKWGTGLTLVFLSTSFTNPIASDFLLALTSNLSIIGLLGLLIYKTANQQPAKNL